MTGRPLQVQLGIRIVSVAFSALTVMVVLLGFLTHGHMHRQTDALLLHLAHAEATNMLDEGSGAHVHNMAIHLPGLTGGLRERYALVFDESGRVLDHTGNIDPGETAPSSWPISPDEEPRFFNASEIAEPLLRMVALPMKLDGERVFIAVGVAHSDLDASLWSFVSIAIPVALLAIAMIGFAGVWLIRRRIVDLTRLGRACRNLELFSGRISGDRDRQALTVPESAAEEIRVLAGTLQELIDRVEALLETQNRFVAEAAHELRTPLTSLRGDLELALRRERSAEDYKELIAEALTDVDRLTSLAVDLLEGARGRDSQLELHPHALLDLVDEALDRRAKLLKQAGFSVTVHVPHDLGVKVDWSGAVRILENLLDNAARHSGGAKLEIKAETDEEWTILTLCDDGEGIDPELMVRLFHPFQRGSQKGFGLGLYIAHELMRAQNGQLSVETGAGPLKGACWTLKFCPA